MEDPRIISALFIFLKMAYYNVLINSNGKGQPFFRLSLIEKSWQVATLPVADLSALIWYLAYPTACFNERPLYG